MRWQESKFELDELRKIVEKKDQDFRNQLTFNRNATAKIKEDYEIMEDRNSKSKEMYEKLVANLREELHGVKINQKELQDFYDRYDVIIQDERKNNINQIREINDQRDKIEN